MDQHNCPASVGSNVLRSKPARMRVWVSATAGILSALAPGCLADEFAVSTTTRLRFRCDCFPWVSDEPAVAFSVVEDVVLLGDMGVHSLGDGSRVRISPAADD